MPSLQPRSYGSLLVRTDFRDEQTWTAVAEAITRETPEGFLANVRVVDDAGFDGYTTDQILSVAVDSHVETIVFIVDQTTIDDADHPVLVLAPKDRFRVQRGQTFRALPTTVQSIENNLNLSNMDWPDFADRLNERGYFAGF